MENHPQAFVLTVRETCDALRIGRTKFYEFCNSGQLQAIKIGGSTRVTMESIQALLARAVAAAPANDDEPVELAVGAAK